MKLQQVFVTRVQEVKTQYGQRLVIDCLNFGEKVTVWRSVGDAYALSLHAGDAVTVAIDSKGKASLIVPTEDSTAITVNSQRLETKSYQPSQHFPLATMPKPVVKAVEVPENSGGAFDRHIASLASRIADCYRATKAELPELSEETIQKLATSVFIQLAKDTY